MKKIVIIIAIIIAVIIGYCVYKNANTSVETSSLPVKEVEETVKPTVAITITPEPEPEELTIYDIEEGYLIVKSNPRADKHKYNWDNLDNSTMLYKYEDENYTSKLGVDVSEYQGDIDWGRLKEAGVEFAILRLGYRGYGQAGRIVLDEKFEENYTGAIENGIEVGVYFFSQAINIEEVREEADIVLERLEGKQITYPVAFDLERIKHDDARTDNLTNEEISNMALEFCKIIECNGYTPCVYGNSKTFTTKMALEQFNNYNKWYADYLEKPLYPYEFSIWQYTEKGRIDGIEGNTDLNICFVKK